MGEMPRQFFFITKRRPSKEELAAARELGNQFLVLLEGHEGERVQEAGVEYANVGWEVLDIPEDQLSNGSLVIDKACTLNGRVFEFIQDDTDTVCADGVVAEAIVKALRDDLQRGHYVRSIWDSGKPGVGTFLRFELIEY